ncbi:hypothetical protein SAMN02744775_03409 [Enterobacter sp. CC120223-11]|nr:hypothetical protein SAMN02744775_03409 [Enterobacter sp. CC120223-11]
MILLKIGNEADFLRRVKIVHHEKAKARETRALDVLFSQGDDAQSQASKRGCATGNSASGFPVILRGAFHAGIGMNQPPLIVINRHAR